MIGRNPYAGKIEPNLEDDSDMYCSFVVAKLNKIVYRIVDNKIVIDDFWDCRQAPESLADRVG